jgi:hypothetical protein
VALGASIAFAMGQATTKSANSQRSSKIGSASYKEPRRAMLKEVVGITKLQQADKHE